MEIEKLEAIYILRKIKKHYPERNILEIMPIDPRHIAIKLTKNGGIYDTFWCERCDGMDMNKVHYYLKYAFDSWTASRLNNLVADEEAF